MSGLQGRGGGGFPLWRKIQAALDAPGDPMLVLNCSESEPASRKDWVVSSRRPQLMLEGAAYLARLLCADEVFVHLHHGATETMTSLQRAVEERAEARAGEPVWRLSSGPAGYVAGEGSAIARFLHAGVALPMFSTVPLAHRGPAGRPTVVCNAETAAQVAAIMRIGAAAWRALGSASCPGPQLLTLTGAVPRPGTVVEVTGQTSIGEILSDAGVTAPPAAVLVGGYAGTWLRGETAWGTSMEPTALARLGASRGCGLLGVLPRGTCGLAETARLTVFLAGESAGQCGPCVHGLPVLADCMIRLATGAAGRRTMRRLRRTGDGLPGSGACAHPDGVVRLVRSALDVFDADLVLHRSGRPCRPSEPALFPVPGFRAS
jgi:NADH:ubiquinone oxidoreductase subunit F (NADH-binding)